MVSFKDLTVLIFPPVLANMTCGARTNMVTGSKSREGM